MLSRALLAFLLSVAIQPAPDPGGSILVFSRTEGYRHASIEPGIEALRALGRKHQFTVVATEDADVFAPDQLKRFDAIVFLNTTRDVLGADQERAMAEYIRGGGGFVGIHSAADTEYDWPWYGQLVGAYFDGHPNDPNVREGILQVVDSTHAAVAFLPHPWVRTDEWYDYRFVGGELNVLLLADEASYKRPDEEPSPEPHPISWYHEFDGGRVFYTGLGHTSESFSEPLYLEHILGGLRYAAGWDSSPG